MCRSETWISLCSLASSRSKRRVNGLERYDAVRAAYSSLDSRSVSCRAIEMLGRALVAQTFVTASLGVVFSPEIAIDLYRDRSPDPSVTSRQFDRNRKRESGRWSKPFLTAFFTRKRGAKNSRKNSGSYLHRAESKSEFKKIVIYVTLPLKFRFLILLCAKSSLVFCQNFLLHHQNEARLFDFPFW